MQKLNASKGSLLVFKINSLLLLLLLIATKYIMSIYQSFILVPIKYIVFHMQVFLFQVYMALVQNGENPN